MKILKILRRVMLARYSLCLPSLCCAGACTASISLSGARLQIRLGGLLVVIALMFSMPALADVSCTGVPTQVYVGAVGPSPAGQSIYVAFSDSSQPYYIGLVTDDLAKARLATAMVAMTSNQSLTLRFYSASTCADALADALTPSAVILSSN